MQRALWRKDNGQKASARSLLTEQAHFRSIGSSALLCSLNSNGHRYLRGYLLGNSSVEINIRFRRSNGYDKAVTHRLVIALQRWACAPPTEARKHSNKTHGRKFCPRPNIVRLIDCSPWCDRPDVHGWHHRWREVGGDISRSCPIKAWVRRIVSLHHTRVDTTSAAHAFAGGCTCQDLLKVARSQSWPRWGEMLQRGAG